MIRRLVTFEKPPQVAPRGGRRTARMGRPSGRGRGDRRRIARLSARSSSPWSLGPASRRTSSVYGGSVCACRLVESERSDVVVAAKLVECGVVEIAEPRGRRCRCPRLPRSSSRARCGSSLASVSGRCQASSSIVIVRPSAISSASCSGIDRYGCISWMSMPNRRSRSSGGGLKNVHWSPSKSIRTVEPSAASGSSPRACRNSIARSA